MRSNLFWTVDFIRGKKVTEHYNQIKLIMEAKDSSKANQLIDNNLENLLKYAVTHTDFYSSHQNFKSLEDFPIINKNIIRADYNKFISKKYSSETLFKVTTSGSTGTPFKAYQDAIKRARHIADNIYFNEKAELDLGERLYYFRVWNKINKKDRLKKFMQNIIECDAGTFTKDAIGKLLNQMKNDNSKKSMLAYSSTYEALVTKIKEYELSTEGISMSSIITMSETLPDQTKVNLGKMFNCPVISRYSNMENGFLAQQCISENNEYHLNTASFKIELLKFDENSRVANGEMGRIVVTDLFNYGMPIIRYDTGDIAIMEDNGKCDWQGTIFSKVLGRKVDFIYSTNDEIISPHVITNTMWKYPDINQFQFIQKSQFNFILKLNSSVLEPMIEKDIEINFKSYLGENANINFEYVEEIPVLNSGKRKKIVNEYKVP